MKEKIKYDIGDEIEMPKDCLSYDKKKIGKISMITVTKKSIKYRIYNGFDQLDVLQEDLK